MVFHIHMLHLEASPVRFVILKVIVLHQYHKYHHESGIFQVSDNKFLVLHHPKKSTALHQTKNQTRTQKVPFVRILSSVEKVPYPLVQENNQIYNFSMQIVVPVRCQDSQQTVNLF